MPALIGALRVSLSADTASFHSGMKRAEAQARTTGGAISKSLGLIKSGFAGLAAGLSVGLITQGIKNALEYAGSLGEVAAQLGVTTRELQLFRFAATQNGVSQDEMDKGLQKLTISMSKAASGSKVARTAFASVGVTLEDIKTKSKTEIFGMIADQMLKQGGAAKNAAAGVTIFGKSVLQMAKLLDEGSRGLNALATAAEELGIILSDEQIKNADETADKLDALKTVLSSQIAGVVADNAASILQLANALVAVAGAAVRATANFGSFISLISRNVGILTNPAATIGKMAAAGSATAVIPKARRTGYDPTDFSLAYKSTGGEPPEFLGGGGGSKKKAGGKDDAERKRLEALRDAFQFEEEQRRADMDILRAKQQLAHEHVERTALAIEMLNLEKESFEAELQYRIAAKELTVPQADILRAKFAINDALQRQVTLEEDEADRLREYNQLADLDFDLQRDKLQSEAQLAETASERRDVELRLLDLIYKQERARLEAVLADEQSTWAAKEEARRRLAALNETEANDREGVIAGTRGPMEDWLASLPTTAAKAQEALEQLQVEAFDGLIDAAVLLTEGFDGAKDALLGTLKSFLQGLLRMQLQKALGNLIGSTGIFGGGIGGGAGGFATGGFTGGIGRNRIAGFVHGNEFVLNAAATSRLGVPSLDALNRGASLSAVSNDNGRGPTVQNFNFPNSDYDSFRRNQRQMARDARRGLAIQ